MILKPAFKRVPFLAGAAVLATLAGCGEMEDDDVSASFGAALGDRIPGGSTNDGNFAAFRDNFNAQEELDEGLGPIFNEHGCGVCHDRGAVGGAGLQIERRYGRFVNGAFDPLANRGGSLRQLFTVGPFTGVGGQSCNPPVEVEPAEATVRNVGRLATPLFGLGLVDSLPDSTFDGLAAAQPTAIRGIVNRVRTDLPNDRDAAQTTGGTRVGRFGWKAGVPNLLQFSGDAYVNEMGITTQTCIRGQSNNSFAVESAPNGIPTGPGCDDQAPRQTGANPGGSPALSAAQWAQVDDAVGSCAGGLTLVQKDIDNFKRFMTNLAAPPRGTITAQVTAGQAVYDAVGCAGCHTRQTFRSPSPAPNGVPSGIAFQPFSDFLVHDMGALGDQIGNAGDTLAVTRRMRTAPLWGLRFRPLLLHDGRTGDVATAIRAHDGQGAAARDAFNARSATDQANLVAFVRSL